MSNNLVLPPVTSDFVTLATNPPPTGIAPPYLLATTGKAYLYSMSAMYDALEDGAGYAVRAGLPTYAPTDAFQWLQADRQVDQGFSESNASFAKRLTQWLDLWRHAGASTGMLLAMLGATNPVQPMVRTVQESGASTLGGTYAQAYNTWDSYYAGANPFPAGAAEPTPPLHQVVLGTQGTWNWDGASTPFYAPWMWWRKWVIIYSSNGSPYSTPVATWGPASGTANVIVTASSTYGTIYTQSGPASTQGPDNIRYGANGVGTCWGWAGTNAQARSLTALARKWKSGHVWIPYVLIAYSASLFDPADTWGSPNLPNGQWGNWGQVLASSTYGSVYARARPAESQVGFIDGTRRDLNTSY